MKIVGPDGEPLAPQPAQAAEDPAALRAERDDLLARLQRLGADYQNYQKRIQKELAQEREYANESLLRAMLSVLDDMERGLAAARENHPTNDPLLVGMQLVHDKLLETFGRFGLTVIPTQGQPFNPEKHSAMMQEPSAEVEPMTILRELQKGYTLKGRTLRPSAVVVAQAPQQPATQEPPTDDTQPPAEEEP